MKSAYERALERFGMESETACSEEHKKELAEIDSLYDAKAAEARIRADAEVRDAAQDAEKVDQVRERLSRDLAAIESRRETAKDKVRAAQRG